MTGFDAELHLRLLAERMLASGRAPRDPRESQLSSVARALVAVGAIGVDTAEAVIDDYDVALELRSGHIDPYFRRARKRQRRRPPVAPAPRRVVPCDTRIEREEGTMHVRSVHLADDATTVAFLATTPPEPRASGYRAPFGTLSEPFDWLEQMTLADDRGTSTIAFMSGHGDEEEWHGRMHAQTPLARDAAWIEIDGTRIDLVDGEQAGTVVVEELPAEAPAIRHLWSLIAAPDRFHAEPTDLEPVIDAFVAAGALAADDPRLTQVRRIAKAIDPYRDSRAKGTRFPEPWRSLMARRHRLDGPSGSAAIGLVTPEFDGVVVEAVTLDSGPEGFNVDVTVAPFTGSPFGPEHLRDPGPLTWWARDDRGNHYLGRLGNWAGGDDHGEGEIAFEPAIDPEARRLDLMPTGATRRAVMSFPLPWSATT